MRVNDNSPATPVPGVGIYRQVVDGALGRALSRLDWEPTSASRGSFDRTWWGWKFTDFSAARFQEGLFTLAWLLTSPAAPPRARSNERLLEGAVAAIHFWRKLQHRDGSFDEAYPFERSLAATAFTGFYVGSGLERLRSQLTPNAADAGLQAIERGADWLARNGEYHGVLSNHLAAAAAALHVAGDLLATDRFKAARDRYLGIIYANQDPEEGWLREYGGADPGYQSHAMFYLAEIWRRGGDAELFERLGRATRFIAWFAHPDGTLGGEYASRGTKFAYPAAFEMLARDVPAAAGVAAHLRRCMAQGRGVGPHQMDAWNIFPVLNNYLFACDAAGDLSAAPRLPWQDHAGWNIFERAGLAVGCAGGRLLVSGLSLGGACKLWDASRGALIYEDCGYALVGPQARLSSQSASSWTVEKDINGELRFRLMAPFTPVPSLRFGPWRFLAFRAFTLTIGRLPVVARGLKGLLVRLLIRRKAPHAARLERCIAFDAQGRLRIEDEVRGLERPAVAVDRQVPFHMGSARYADFPDWLGAEIRCPEPQYQPPGRLWRIVEL
ncbi:MAG TPA: hypothetical protein VHW24_09295 [Bryobacteraceae bacterium]|nr:hypothetical protein [Bryobacteraceae bacterium]